MTTDFGASGGTELVVVSAKDDYELASEASRIVAYLDRVPDVPLVDVAYTCSLTHGAAVLALVVSSVHELRERLVSARDRIGDKIFGQVTDLQRQSIVRIQNQSVF